MNRSFSKINHIQKANMLLENRMLQYKTLIKEAVTIHVTSEDKNDIVFKTGEFTDKKFYYSCATKKITNEAGTTETEIVLSDDDKTHLELKCIEQNKAV